MAKKKRTGKKNKKLIFAVIAAVLMVAGIITSVVLYKQKYPVIKPKETVKLASLLNDVSDIKLIAHRGFSGIAPENTLPAFEKAGESKFYGAECDVHITTDGEWVIIHNDNTRLMCGVSKKVSKSTFSEIQALNITNGANIGNYYTVKIPTLSEYLDVCFEYSLIPVIEIKTEAYNKGKMQSLYDTVTTSPAGESAIFISFSKEAIAEIKEIDPHSKCWLLINELNNETVDFCKQNNYGIDFNANYKKLSDETVMYALSSGMEVACWTVDTPDLLIRMHTLGVKTFTTNTIIPEV